MIVVEINYQMMQNILILKQRKIEKMTEKVQAIKNIKKNYAKTI